MKRVAVFLVTAALAAGACNSVWANPIRSEWDVSIAESGGDDDSPGHDIAVSAAPPVLRSTTPQVARGVRGSTGLDVATQEPLSQDVVRYLSLIRAWCHARGGWHFQPTLPES